MMIALLLLLFTILLLLNAYYCNLLSTDYNMHGEVIKVIEKIKKNKNKQMTIASFHFLKKDKRDK